MGRERGDSFAHNYLVIPSRWQVGEGWDVASLCASISPERLARVSQRKVLGMFVEPN